MTDTKLQNLNKILVVLVILLVAATAVQGFYLFKIYRGSQDANQVVSFNPNTSPVMKNSSANGSIAPARSPGWAIGSDPDDLWLSWGDEWDPFAEMHKMQERMNRLFDESFGRYRMAPGFNANAADLFFSPRFDMKEEDDRYIVKMDIPGADQSNLKVNVDDRLLTVSGSTDETVEEQDGNHILRKERRSGQFQRSITLPGPVRTGQMTTDYEDGVLTVTFPKGDAVGTSASVTINKK